MHAISKTGMMLAALTIAAGYSSDALAQARGSVPKNWSWQPGKNGERNPKAETIVRADGTKVERIPLGNGCFKVRETTGTEVRVHQSCKGDPE